LRPWQDRTGPPSGAGLAHADFGYPGLPLPTESCGRRQDRWCCGCAAAGRLWPLSSCGRPQRADIEQTTDEGINLDVARVFRSMVWDAGARGGRAAEARTSAGRTSLPASAVGSPGLDLPQAQAS